jgi:hypothetical protein
LFVSSTTFPGEFFDGEVVYGVVGERRDGEVAGGGGF